MFKKLKDWLYPWVVGRSASFQEETIIPVEQVNGELSDWQTRIKNLEALVRGFIAKENIKNLEKDLKAQKIKR